MTRDLEEIFPIWGMEQDCIFSRQGDMTLAFRAVLPEIFTLSAEQYEILHQAWVRALQVLPYPAIIHKQDWFVERRYRESFERSGEFLESANRLHFNERPFLGHDCLVFVTAKARGRQASSSAWSSLIRPSLVPVQLLDEKHLHRFRDCVEQFSRILSGTGLISLEILEAKDLLSNEKKAGWLERYCFLTRDPNLPVVADLGMRDGLRIGGQQCQIFTLSDPDSLPPWVGPRVDLDQYSTEQSVFSVGFASCLGQLLPCNHIYNQFIFLDEPGKMLKDLERKRLRLQSLSLYSRGNGIARDAIAQFLDEAITHQRMPVRAHFNVMIWAPDEERLGESRNLVATAFAGMNAAIRQESLGAAQIYWAAIPGNAADFPMNDSFITFADHSLCLLNPESGPRSSTGNKGMRLASRLDGRPLWVDLSDEPLSRGLISNRNKFILGPSGSGKSFFTNHMVRSYYDQGAHIVLVDIGHSYQGLCQLLGGSYFTYSQGRPFRFNPFLRSVEIREDPESRESLKALLMALWKKEDEAFNRAEYIALSGALQSYEIYLEGNPQVFPCFNSFYEFLLEDFRKENAPAGSRQVDLDNFLYVLRPYYRGGEFDYLLNSPAQEDLLNQRLIVFELDYIKDHPILLPVVTIIIMEVFIHKMRMLPGIRKIILIEEAWKAIAREGMGQYIRYLFKTVRKYFGEAVVVTQEVEDILDSPVVRQAILNNADCKILLDHSRYLNRFDPIRKLLGLTAQQQAEVLSLNLARDPGAPYREVFISLGAGFSRVYRTEVSPEEYLVYTTEEKEKVAVRALTGAFGGDLEKAVFELARRKRLARLEGIPESSYAN
ncbi:MAG TPA: TraG family conjugative transposon ATPase [Chitinophagaceae bacterium]|nr:TraG family conjugative transposon ATPase [Chitinophagaceae bacterium]